MDRAVENGDSGVFVGGAYMSYSNYLDEAYGRVQPCLNEIMTYCNDAELSDYVQNGTAAEREKAELELAVRRCEASFSFDKKNSFFQMIEAYGGMSAFILDGLGFYGLMAVLTALYIVVGA